MSAYAFLFDADELAKVEPTGYHRPALRSLFQTLLAADAHGAEAFVLLHGDLLHRTLAYRTTSVRRSRRRGAVQIAQTQAADRDLFVTIVWDLCDSIGQRWCSLDLADLPRLLGRRNVYVAAISELAERIAQDIDNSLREVAGYVGGFAPDAGNPIHQRVTVGSLIEGPYYTSRSLLYDPWETESPEDPPPLVRHGDEWYADLGFAAIRYIADDRERSSLPQWPSADLSDRGAMSLSILETRTRATHMDRVGTRARRLFDPGADDFEIDTTTMARADDAIVERRKLTEYLLNPDHPEGRTKAQLFESALAITAED